MRSLILLSLLGLASASLAQTGPSYAYVYDTSEDQVVKQGNLVMFGQNGSLSADMAHAQGTPGVTVGTAGVYRIAVQMASESDSSRAYRGEISPFCIQVNGQAVPGGQFVSCLSFSPLYGEVIIPLAAHDVVTVCNRGPDAMLNNDHGSVAVGLTLIRLGP